MYPRLVVPGMTSPYVSGLPSPSGSRWVNAVAMLARSAHVRGTGNLSLARQSARTKMANDWAENGTPNVLPLDALAAVQARSETWSAPAMVARSSSCNQPCCCIVPSWAVSLMTTSGSWRWAACCCSLVSKSSYSDTSRAFTPVCRVNARTSRSAVFAVGDPGTWRIQISRVAFVSCRTSTMLVDEHPVRVTASTTAASRAANGLLFTSSALLVVAHRPRQPTLPRHPMTAQPRRYALTPASQPTPPARRPGARLRRPFGRTKGARVADWSRSTVGPWRIATGSKSSVVYRRSVMLNIEDIRRGDGFVGRLLASLSAA